MMLEAILLGIIVACAGLLFYWLGYRASSNYWCDQLKANLSREYCDGFAHGKAAAFNAMKRKLDAKENQA